MGDNEQVDKMVSQLGALLIKLVTQGAQTLWDRTLLSYSQGDKSVGPSNGKIRLEVQMDDGQVLRFNKEVTDYVVVKGSQG